MHKISEKLDLSKKVLDIDIESPVFTAMISSLNQQIQKVIKLVYDEKFKSGEIALKLNIELPNAYKEFPRTDELTGEMIVDTFKYRKPVFEHKLTTTLKKQFKDEGGYTDERDVQFQDGHFVAVPLKRNQISLFDEAEKEMDTTQSEE